MVEDGVMGEGWNGGGNMVEDGVMGKDEMVVEDGVMGEG